MNYLHTYIQLQSDEEVLFSIDDVILPAVIGDNIQVNELWYKVIDISYHCGTPSCNSISKTIWVIPRKD